MQLPQFVCQSQRVCFIKLFKLFKEETVPTSVHQGPCFQCKAELCCCCSKVMYLNVYTKDYPDWVQSTVSNCWVRILQSWEPRAGTSSNYHIKKKERSGTGQMAGHCLCWSPAETDVWNWWTALISWAPVYTSSGGQGLGEGTVGIFTKLRTSLTSQTSRYDPGCVTLSHGPGNN